MDIHGMSAQGLNQCVISKIIKEIKNKNYDNIDILDLGAGEGINSYLLYQELEGLGINYNILAVDINGENFKLKNKKNINFKVGDLNSEFNFGKFDIIIGTEIIEHLENPYLFIRNILNSLNEKGFSVITSPNIESLFSILRILLLKLPMWFSVNEPSGHIIPIFSFMIQEALRRNKLKYSLEIDYNRGTLRYYSFLKKRFNYITIPIRNRLFGEISIYTINKI